MYIYIHTYCMNIRIYMICVCMFRVYAFTFIVCQAVSVFSSGGHRQPTRLCNIPIKVQLFSVY